MLEGCVLAPGVDHEALDPDGAAPQGEVHVLEMASIVLVLREGGVDPVLEPVRRRDARGEEEDDEAGEPVEQPTPEPLSA